MADVTQKAYYAVIPATVRYDKDLPPNAKLLYGEITALCNEKGFCWASNDYFAKLYNCTRQSVSGWIGKLKNKGYISVEIVYKEGSKEILDRYIKISEYPIQKNLNTPIQNNLKENNTDINTTSNNTINNISVEFETLWKMYPRKVGKEAALKAYKKARSDKKNPTTFEQVKQGIENYVRQIEAKQTDVQYIKHGSSWFNARAWNDDYDFSPQKPPPNGSQLVKINGKEYEYRNGKYYVPHGCGIAVDPYAEDDILDGIF